MRWLLLTDQPNSISKQCIDLLQVAGQTVFSNEHQGKSSIQEINDRITNEKPDRILVIIDENKSSKLVNDLTTHLLIPSYVAQVTVHPYSPIPVLILTTITDDQDLHLVQNATEQLINIAKLFTPIIDENLNEKYLDNFWKTNPDQFHHIAILSDILPIILALIHDGKAHGSIHVCNKGTVSLNSFGNHHENSIKCLDTENITDQFETLNNQMITPETRQLYQASFVLPNVTKSIEHIVRQNALNTNPNSPKIILITGGCGFIGSTFINHWLSTYPTDQIINIDRLDSVANMKNITNATSPNYSFIQADINNKDIALHLCNQYNITHIIHFAVQAHLDTSFGNSITFTESNVYGTHSVLEASRIYGKILKFIHISTDEVYGETPAGSNQEICLLNPINPYAATIAAAEFLVKSYGESFKIPYCIVRLCNVYGPCQHFEKAIPTFIHSLLKDKQLTIHGDGQQARHYLYIDDVVHAIEMVFLKGKTKMIYNIGTTNRLTVLEIVQSILDKLQSKKQLDQVITYVKPRSFREKRYCVTTSGLIKSLGWKEEISFDEGLEKTIQWIKSNPEYWKK